jgi:excisionase family DNA binding protein
VTAARRRLDPPRQGERGYPRRQAPAPVGGSNRLLTAAEVADYLGVPVKTIYARWQDWGLTACRVGRHLRFRQRHVEDWLDRQEH